MQSGKSQTKQSQIQAFRKAAREVGCDDNAERFNGALRKIANTKAKPKKKKQPD